MDYRHGSHTAYNIEYHFVWATKYRKYLLRGDVAARTRELVRQTCDAFEIKILKGVVSGDPQYPTVSRSTVREAENRVFSFPLVMDTLSGVP